MDSTGSVKSAASDIPYINDNISESADFRKIGTVLKAGRRVT